MLHGNGNILLIDFNKLSMGNLFQIHCYIVCGKLLLKGDVNSQFGANGFDLLPGVACWRS